MSEKYLTDLRSFYGHIYPAHHSFQVKVPADASEITEVFSPEGQVNIHLVKSIGGFKAQAYLVVTTEADIIHLIGEDVEIPPLGAATTVYLQEPFSLDSLPAVISPHDHFTAAIAAPAEYLHMSVKSATIGHCLHEMKLESIVLASEANWPDIKVMTKWHVREEHVVHLLHSIWLLSLAEQGILPANQVSEFIEDYRHPEKSADYGKVPDMLKVYKTAEEGRRAAAKYLGEPELLFPQFGI